YWYLFGIIVTTVLCFFLMYIIIAKYQIEYVLGGLILVSFCIAESIIAIRYIMQDKDLKIKNNLGISGIFTKPELVTEEEVSVSKEKKICIVCKRKLAGFKLAFICRECDTLYCEKCVRTLSKLENACWVCNAPFDETKPVKLPKKEKEEITVQDIEEPKKAK
ncbi:MAG: DC1 domain-containing protein, partial [Promethearchaeota archaeon]